MGLATTNTMTGGLFKKKFGRKKKLNGIYLAQILLKKIELMGRLRGH